MGDSDAKVSIHHLIKFSRLLLTFQEVIRKVRIPGREVEENDVEHSYQLAMMAWYLNEVGKHGLDAALLIKYALVHDLTEVYAGDFHVLDHAGRIGKEEREAAALEQIADEFSDFPELVECIDAYERKADFESRFVYALDKLMPMIMIYLEGGSTWRELNFSMEELLLNKDEKTALCPAVQQLGRELEALVRLQPELFNRA